jgi:flagellar motility protein MotE (MotC chaperone)
MPTGAIGKRPNRSLAITVPIEMEKRVMTNQTNRGESGQVNFIGMSIIFLATAIILAVVMLFVTGVAQRSIIPRLKARSERAVPEALPQMVAEGGQTAGEFDERAATAAAIDSLRALREQVRIEQAALDTRIATYEEMVEELMAARRVADEDTTAEIASIAKVVSNMKPIAAANVLAGLDDISFMRVFKKLNQTKAAKILTYIDPVRISRLFQDAVTSPAETTS